MNKKMINHCLLQLSALLMLGLTSGCISLAPSESSQWFRGNTHSHTILCGHADSTPEVVTKWYHDNGYNFLILSEHNRFIDPETVKMPEPLRKDFILVPGEELTEGPVHSTAMNISGLVEHTNEKMSKKERVQSHVERISKADGSTVLNHPNFGNSLRHEHIFGVKGLYMFELYNGHPHVHSYGTKVNPSTEVLWDSLLTEGMLIYGVSSDDAHHFKSENIKPDKSNPGRGWVMVRAKELTPDALTGAMLHGEFYASNGVFLDACQRQGSRYTVSIDQERTLKELENPLLRGKKTEGNGKPGFRIEWIAKGGKVLRVDRALKSSFEAKKEHLYLRPKITFTRPHPKNGFEEYYAWGQPLFTDARADVAGPEPSDHSEPDTTSAR